MRSQFKLFPKPALAYKFSCAALFFIAIVCFKTDVATAQSLTKKAVSNKDSLMKRFEIGLNGGMSFNQFTKGQPHAGKNTGYTAGLSVNYKIISNFSLQLEVNALQQGGSLVQFVDKTWLGLPESFETKNVTNSSYALNSIDIPLLINYTINIKPAWKPAVYAGAGYSYTYNVTENYQKTGNLLAGEDIIATASGSRNSTSRFKTNRANLIVGANIKLPLTDKLMFLIDMRYMRGVTSAIENYSYMDKTGFGTDLRTNSFVSKIGVLYAL